MSKAITVITKLLSSDSLIFVGDDKNSAVDLKRVNSILVGNLGIIFGDVINYSLVDNRFEEFTNET